MDKKILENYSKIIITKGINLYKGQCLDIRTGLINYDFALLLAETAYKLGAKYVNIETTVNELVKRRINYSESSHLEYIPDYIMSKNYEQLANDWGFIRIDNTGEINVLKNIDTDKLDIIIKSARKSRKRMLEELSKHKLTWNVNAFPNQNWADKIYGTENDPDSLKKLWETIIPILRLDNDDPVKAWDEHGANLIERGKKLTALNLSKLIYKSSKTDLEIGLNKTSIWIGGPEATPDGRIFFPNIPTEETFTTPDWRKTNGIVYTTKPVKLMETIINGAWFEFKDGKVVKFGASNNENIIEKFINTDDGASYLGEAALVDVKSPINQSGVIFNSILYDENASCHIAIGNGYPTCLSNGHLLRNKEELKNAGCNVSLVHTDFMIGSEDMDITGVDFDGKEHKIIENGSFVI